MSISDNLQKFGTQALDLLGGGATQPDYSVDPATGNTVTQPVQQSKGSLFRNIVQGALSGLAGGVQTNQNGAPGGLAALAGGYEANSQRLQQQDQQKKQQAQQQFGNQNTANMQRAHMAQMDLEHSISSFKLANDQHAVQQGELDHFNSMQDLLQKTPGAEHLGTYKNWDAYVNSLPPDQRDDAVKKLSAGEIKLGNPVAADEAGNPKVVGVDIYHVPKAFLDKPIAEATPVGLIHHVDPKTGIDKPEQISAPAGSISYGEAIAMNQKNLKDEVISPKAIYEAKVNSDLEASKEEAADRRQDSRNNAMLAAADRRAAANQPLQGPEREAVLNTIRNYQLDPSHLNRYMGKDPALAGEIGPDWSEGQYKAGVKALDSYGSGKDHQQMLATGTAIQHLAGLRDLAAKLPETSDLRILNQGVATFAKQIGRPDITNYNGLQHALSEELAKAYKGGVPDKEFEKKLDDDFSNAGSPKQLIGQFNTHAHALHDRSQEQAGELRNVVPNVTTLQHAPNFSKGAEAAFHSFGQDNPFNMGAGPKPENGGNNSITKAPKYVMDQFMKITNGDKQQAWKLAQARGWSN